MLEAWGGGKDLCGSLCQRGKGDCCMLSTTELGVTLGEQKEKKKFAVSLPGFLTGV